MARITQIQVRRDQSASWTSINPTLASGEIGFETDTGKFKIGTGSTNWTTLKYITDDSYLVSGVSSTGSAGTLVKYGNNGSISASTGSFTNVIATGSISASTGSFTNVIATGSSLFSNITASSSSIPILNLITTASNSSQSVFTISNPSGQIWTYFSPGLIGVADSSFTTNITIDATAGLSLQNGPILSVGNSNLGSGYLRHTANLTFSIGDNITASGGIKLGTSVSTINMLGTIVHQGNTYGYQPAASAVNATATLNASTILLGIITSTTAAAVTLTLPTGTNFENIINTYLTPSPVNTAWDFNVINTGSNTLTLATATGWTLTGQMTVSASTSARFRARKSATNTFTLYRV